MAIEPQTEREWIFNLDPRVKAVESRLDKTEKRQDGFDKAMKDLRRDLLDTELRLGNKVDERFDKVDEHLSNQDERLDKVVDAKRRWPQGAIISVTAVATLLAGVGVAAFTHLHF